jgi:hypothetical protein
MLSAASPVPTLPNMKFESRTVSSWSGLGYTTVICSGPRTSGTGGSFGFAGGRGAGTTGKAIGAGTDGPVAGLQDAATVAAQQAKTLNVEGFIVGLKVARAMP